MGIRKKDLALYLIVMSISTGVVLGGYFHAKENLWVTKVVTEQHQEWWDSQPPAWQTYYCSVDRGVDCPPDKAWLLIYVGMGGILVVSSLLILIADWNKTIEIPAPKPRPEPKWRK